MARPKVYSAELRDRLVEATATTIAIHGPVALSLRHLAADVGTSTNAVYALFGSRDDLIQAVVEEAGHSLRQAQVEAAGEGRTVTDLEALAWAHYRWARANPAMYGVMYGGGQAGRPSGPAVDNAAEPLVELVTQLVRTGALRPEPVDVIVHGIHATMHGLAGLDATTKAAPPDPETARSCLRTAVRAWQA